MFMTPLRILLVTIFAAMAAGVPIALAAEMFNWSQAAILLVSAIFVTPICLWGLRRTHRALDEQERQAQDGGTPAATAH